MSAAITRLQAALVTAFRADAALVALLGANPVADAPPRGTGRPYAAIVRHDAVARDGDAAPGFEHLVVIHVRAADASRRAVAGIAERLIAVATATMLSGAGLAVTLAVHLRTETRIDARTGEALAAVALRFHSEPG